MILGIFHFVIGLDYNALWNHLLLQVHIPIISKADFSTFPLLLPDLLQQEM